MRCPRDQTVLKPFPIHQGVISSCTRCQGVWIPWSLIETATTSKSMLVTRPELIELSSTAARCPQDGERLRETSRKGVRVDYCIRCQGLWLDAGELAHIRQVSAARRRAAPDHSREWGADFVDGMSLPLIDLVEGVVEWLGDAL